MKNRIKELRMLNKMTQATLAGKLGIAQNTLSYWEKGTYDPDNESLQKIADLFECSVDYVLCRDSMSSLNFSELEKYGIMPLPKTKKIPLIGTIACGEPILAEENIEGYCSCPESIDADFCLRAKGDSMINARIFDGDILFVCKQDMVEDGEIAVVLIEDEATVKRVYYDREDNTLTLVPENPKYKVMRFHGERLDQIRILGKVLAGKYDVK